MKITQKLSFEKLFASSGTTVARNDSAGARRFEPRAAGALYSLLLPARLADS